ncbi:MAG: type 4a pilus biogenesis protein PilO [Zhaonellaceae bacterium]|nr:type 4a pilus biogenesis protein PilO [Clostridia bacterium]
MQQLFSLKEKKILLPLVFFLIGTLFIQIFMRFVLPTYKSTKTILEKKRQEIVDAYNLTLEIEHLSRQKYDLNSKLNDLLGRFQVSLAAGYPLVYLDTDDLNLKLDNITPYTVYRTDYYSTLPIDMEISGTYLSVLTYLERIENLPAIVEIVSPTITVNEEKQVVCSFKLNIYSTDIAFNLNDETPDNLGKFNIFTPLVQALASIDSEQKPIKSKNENSIQSEFPINSTSSAEMEQPTQEEQVQKDEIYYHFPSR